MRTANQTIISDNDILIEYAETQMIPKEDRILLKNTLGYAGYLIEYRLKELGDEIKGMLHL